METAASSDDPLTSRLEATGRPFATARRLVGGVGAIWWGCAAVLALLWSSVAWTVFLELSQQEQHAVTEVTLEARGVSEYLSLNLFAVDRLMAEVRENWRGGPIPSDFYLTSELKRDPPFLLGIDIIDATGNVLASTSDWKEMRPMDRQLVRGLALDAADRLLFSGPFRRPLAKGVSMQMMRPLLTETGAVGGAVVATVDPNVLRLGAQDPLQDGATVTLVGREDGLVRIRLAQTRVSWGESVLAGGFWTDVSRKPRGAKRAMSEIDGQERLFGFHQVGDYPLAVVVSVPFDTIWRLGRGRLQLPFALAIAFSLVLILAARARAQLEAEQEENIRLLTQSRFRELQANRMKSSFLASVSHDLRTPLNSILGFSELIRDGSSGPDTRKFAGLIHNSGKHLHSLVNTLLDLAKIEAGRMDVEATEIDLRELMQTVVDTHRVSATRKGLALTLAMPAAGQITTQSDRTKLLVVLNNVLHNAIKFTQSGQIAVSGSFAGDGFLIRVLDSGSGISEADLARVFERFNTVPGASLAQGQGSGLGLALSRHLMELLGGSITLQSRPGAGTQVDIHVPKVTKSE